MKRTYKLLWWLNIAVVLFTLLSYLAPFINPQKIWQASFLGLAYPTLLWINIGFLGIWAIARKKYFLLSLFTILIGWSALSSYVGFALTDSAGDSLSDIKLLTYNTNALYQLTNVPVAENGISALEQFKNFITSQDANVICLQEFPVFRKKLFRDSTAFSKYQHRITPTGTILSKWPIIDSDHAFFPESQNGYLWADLVVNGDTLRVFNIHLQSNSVSKQTDEVLAADLQEQETWSKIRGVLAQVNARTLKRVDQARLVARLIADSPHPVILAGDFNNTPQSFTYRLIARNLIDSFREKGFGIGTTYAGSIPSLRIDFILADASFEVLNSQVIRVDYSDHYPVMSTFSR